MRFSMHTWTHCHVYCQHLMRRIHLMVKFLRSKHADVHNLITILRSCVLMVVLFLVIVMGYNYENWRGCEVWGSPSGFVEYSSSQHVLTVPFLDSWFLEDEGLIFLGSFGTTYPSTHHHIPLNVISPLKDSFVATATLSSLAYELLHFPDCCSAVRSVPHSVIAWYLRVIQNRISVLIAKCPLTWKENWPLSLSLSLSLYIYIYIYIYVYTHTHTLWAG